MPLNCLQAAGTHHPLAPSSERRGVGDVTPLLGVGNVTPLLGVGDVTPLLGKEGAGGWLL